MMTRFSLKAVCAALLLFAAIHPSVAQVSVSSSAKLFEEAAISREETAKIWEGMNEGVRAAESWAEAASAWEKAARAWESESNAERARSAWARFRMAIEKRDSADVRIAILTEARQTLRVNRVSDPLVVRVTDGANRPVAGIAVRFELATRPAGTEGARIETADEKTDSSGVATARVRIGSKAGDYAVMVSVPDLSKVPAVFEFTALPGPAARLEIASGNNQVVRVNQRALSPLVARVTDLYGNPVAGVPVQFRVVSEPEGSLGHGLSAEEVTSDASGICGVRFQAGHLGGSYIILVESGDLEGSPSKFEIMARQTIPTVRAVGVRFEGIVETGALMAGSRIKVGETFLLPELGRLLRDELKRLYATGRFEDLSAGIEARGEGEAILVIRVVERPRVASVALTGMKRIKEADLRGVLGLAEGSYYSMPAVERTRRAILEHYENEGYLRATVAIETSAAAPSPGDPAPAVAVTYRIVEKDKVKIARMNLNGNKFFSDWGLNWHMKTGSGRVYKESEFEEDRQKIMARYVEKGFLSATMSDPVITYDRQGRLILDIAIVEGPRYKIGEISFTGNTAVSSEALLGMLKPQRGQWFRARKFFESIEKMRLATARHGYAEARIIPQERLDLATGIADFVIKVEEGRILYLEEIRVEGTRKTRDKIVTREINLRPGDVLNGEELDKARRRLEGLQFFEQGSVRMDLSQGTKPDQRILTVKLAEGKTGQLQFGAGYSSVDKVVGFFSITKRNFDPFDLWTFTGAGQEITASAEFGGSKSSYSLSWTEPWWRNRPISLGFDVFNLYQEREGFDWRRRGAAVRLSHKYGEYGRLSYKYAVEEIEILKVTSAAPTDVQTEVGFPGQDRFVRRTTSITTAYSHTTKDDNLFPTSGHFFEVSNQLAARFLGGNVSFDRPVINYNYYHRGLSNNHVIAFRGQYGTISNFFERSNPIPTAEKYYLGGVNTVRGYRDRSIQVYATDGTLLGPGSSYGLMNLEYRIPFTDDKSFSIAAFYDIGKVWEGEFTFGTSNLCSGIGMGVRFQTPLGPIRLDYGYGLDFPNKNRGQIHFSIGQMF